MSACHLLGGVNQVGRTGLDLNRLAGDVTAFQNAPPKVGILYSTASNVYTSGTGYVNATNNVYKALLYDGQKAGFVNRSFTSSVRWSPPEDLCACKSLESSPTQS